MRGIKWQIFLLFFFCNSLLSQSSFFKQPTFSIGFYNHSIGVPFKDISKFPLNIGITAGVEFAYGGDLIAKNAQRLEFGWHRHKTLNSAIWIKSDYIRRFTHKSGLYGELRGGLGYIREFGANQSFKLNSEGKYVPYKDPGASGLLVSLGIGTGYRFELNEKLIVSPFIRYEGMLQTPYSKIIPFLPHSMMHVGTRFQFRQ